MGTVKGLIEISVNPEKTQVRLIYTPKSPGEVWDFQKVIHLLERKGIVYGVNRNRIKESLALFGDKDEKTRSVPVAQGRPVSYGNVDFSLPERELDEQLRRIINEVIRRAGAPKFDKEVDSALKGITYVKEGESLGSLKEGFSETPGPGIDVFGNEIAPSSDGQGEFLIGKGIGKSPDGELLAEKSGVIRLGSNWIDLIPFQEHRWEIIPKKDGSGPLLRFEPGMRSFEPPRGGQIWEEAVEKGFSGDNLLEEKEIDSFIKTTIDSRKSAELNLLKEKDSQIKIEVDSSRTTARLVLKKGMGKGKSLSLKDVSAALNNSGLKGIETDKTKKEILKFYHSAEQETSLLLCESEKPERGKDRDVNFSVKFLDDSYRELLLDKVELDESLVSFYESIKVFPMENISRLAVVEKDQKIFSLSADVRGKEGKDVFGNPIPGLPGNDPILHLFENIDFRNGAGSAMISGLLEVGEDRENRTWYARIREHTNAPINITISSNKMAAFLSVGLPRGTGFPADRRHIEEALQKAGVKRGLQNEKVDEAAEASGLGEVVTDLVVAEGKLPMDSTRELKLVQDIDYRDKNRNAVSLKKGDDIGYLITSGDTEGYTVTGEELRPEADEEAVEIGENIREEETDEQDVIKLVAEKSGRLIFTGNKLFVQDTVTIEGDLSVTLGKIIFPGVVEIRGSVLSRAIINAGEDVHIGGVVQAALVSAGNRITIGKGIKGGEKAVLRGLSLSFDYAEEAALMAAESIHFGKAIMRCQVRCNGQIESDDSGTRIVGGEIKVRNGMTVDSIGNERGVETIIQFGQDFLVEDRISQLVRETEKLQQQILRVDEIIEKARGRADKQDLMMNARDKKVRILKTIEKKNVKLFLLREKFEEHFESSIKVTGDLNEGTTFYSHGRTMTVKSKKRSVEIYFDRNSGKISERPL